jgi:hypothetical protein
VNGPIRETFERQLVKKRLNVSSSAISKVFVVKDPFKKDDEQKKDFLKNFSFLIVKNQFAIIIYGRCLV